MIIGLLGAGTASANYYKVTATTDSTDSTTHGGSGTSGSPFLMASLRGAVIAANSNPGSTIILPAGTYKLTITPPTDELSEVSQDASAGDLDITANNTTIQADVGTTPSQVVIQQTTSDLVLDVNPLLVSSFNFTLSGVTVTGGQSEVGGGGMYSISSSGGTITVSNCIFTGNQSLGQSGGFPGDGGAIYHQGGNLVLTSCTFSSNTSGAGTAIGGDGGAIFFDDATGGNPQNGTLTVTNCSFSNNKVTRDYGSGGGAIVVNGPNLTNHTISGCVFTGGTSSNNGGAIDLEQGGLTITGCSFVGNTVTSGTVHGGAIRNSSTGQLTVHYCRFLNNTAATASNGNTIYQSGLTSGSIDVNDNWWGSNSGPQTDDFINNGSTGSVSNYLHLAINASPTSVPAGGSSTITVSLLLDSANNPIAASNLTAFTGLPLTFSQVGGFTISGTTAIQATGTASAIYTAGSTPGSGSATAVLDSPLGATIGLSITAPDLKITKTHTGNFRQGDTSDTYTITVSNIGNASTAGTVSVVDSLPSGLTATGLSGTGWTINQATLTATRSDALAASSSYPPLTLTVSVANNAPGSVTNTATVSGGGEVNTSNDTANDVTTIAPAPDLVVTKTHVGNFSQGQTGATYTITVSNTTAGSVTSGLVSVVDTLPTGLSVTGVSGSGWTVNLGTLTATRSDALSGGSSYPPLVLTVAVANNAPPSVTNSVTVSGGGELNTGNDTANDPTTIIQVADLTISKTHVGNFVQGQTGATYTITVSNNGAGATSGTVSVVDTLPGGLSATALSGSGWNVNLGALTATRTDVLGVGASYPPLTLTVNVSGTAPSSVTNIATVSGGGEAVTANDIATDPTTILSGPDLTVTKSHTGNFSQGQTGATYTINVQNIGSLATSGTVSVVDTLPSGMTATAMSGAGWSVDLPTLTATRSDALASGTSYPPLTVTVNVAGNAAASATNSAVISGGGDVNGSNNTAVDPTIINPAPATSFAVTAPANAAAGATVNFSVVAMNQFGFPAPTYSGTVHFTSSDAQASLPSDIALVSGSGSFSATLKTSGTQAITATDSVSSSISGTSGGITVSPGAATHLSVILPPSVPFYTAFSFTVTALDIYGNTATGYAGTVQFTSNDPGAVFVPTSGTLNSGAGTFTAAFKQASSDDTITATDTVNSSITGTGHTQMSAGPATHFILAAPSPATAGVAFPVSITARDLFNNLATSYSGNPQVTCSDTNALFPPNATLASGSGSFLVTLKTAGANTVSATDAGASLNGTSNTINTVGAAATHFAVVASGSAVAGTPFNVSVTALDQFNNVSAGYAGTVRFTSSDAGAILPPNSTLTNGTGTFSVTLKVAGTNTVTATDTVTSSITGTSGSILTSAGLATHYGVVASGTAVAGVPLNFSVTAFDQFNNLADGYAGMVHFTSNDAQAVLPPDRPLSGGTGTFIATLKTSGSNMIVATDVAMSSISGTSNNILTAAALATHYTVVTSGSAVAGTPISVLVTARDQFNNIATGYNGTAHFTSTDANATLPPDGALSSGTGAFSATLKTSGTNTITATDVLTISITGTSGNIVTSPAAATHYTVLASGTAVAGSPISFSVAAFDQFNNLATGYGGTVHFTSNDASAALPVDSTLVSGSGTFSATLKTSGTNTITATDTVTSSITGTTGDIVTSPASATHYSVVASGTATAGTPISFAVTSLDQFNNVATGYTGTVHFTSSDANAILPVDSTLTSGSGSFSATLKTAGSSTITATDTVTGSITGTSGNINVSPAAATHFGVSAPASATAGTAISVSVTALDPFNNTATGYGGMVHFTSNDAQAGLPANSTLTAGVGVFSATLKTSGTNTIGAADTVIGSIAGTSNAIATRPAAATHYTVVATGTSVAGTAISVSVTALDPFGNIATGYTGTAHFTSNDGQAVLPSDSALSSGAGNFNITFKTAGTNNVTATDTVTPSITGTSNNVSTSPAAASHYTVAAPSSAIAGTAFNVSVTALDPFNNVATGYAGTVHFTSSDANATLPADSTLTNGVGTFSATLKTAGARTITATDTVTSSVTGVTGGITVSAGAATHYSVAAPGSATAGSAFNFSVSALDQFGNTATGYTGIVHFSSSDAQASLPANSTLTNGVGTFSATLKTSGTNTIAATDTVSSSVNGTSGNIATSPASATHYSVAAPSSATAGNAFNISVTALDQFSNVATGYTGIVHFTSTDVQASLPANSTLMNGIGTFSATLKTSGSQTLTARDTVSGSIAGTSNNVAVSAAAATHYTLVATGTTVAGTPVSFSVTALDQFSNIATGYIGTVHFTCSGSNATLPGDSALSSGTGSFSATLRTSGSSTITATDTVNSSITGTSNVITVRPGVTVSYTVAAPANAVAGTAFSFTVTAYDTFGNVNTADGTPVHFTSNDAAAVLPPDTALSAGVLTGTATLKTSGSNRTITATQGGLPTGPTGTSGDIVVSAAAASHFGVSAPLSATAGTAISVTVTALDPYNNTAVGYSGTAHFTSTDRQAMLPADSALTLGVGTFSATLKTAGNQTMTVVDSGSASITGTSNIVAGAPSFATHFSVAAPGTEQAGVAISFSVTAVDAYGNTATGYGGMVHFTSSDAQAVLPGDSTLILGVGIFNATLKTAAQQTITATDTATSSITGTSGDIAVTPAPASRLAVTAPAQAIAGTEFFVAVTALDPFNNVATGYTGTVHFTSSGTSGVMPADSTLASGSGRFVASFTMGGPETITATDTVDGTITGSTSLIIVAFLPPVAVDDVAFTSGTLAVDIDVLANDSAPTGGTLTVTNVTRGLFGNTSINGDNTIHYVPRGTTHPRDSFQYTITNGEGGFATATVTVRDLFIAAAGKYDGLVTSGTMPNNDDTGYIRLHVTDGGVVNGSIHMGGIAHPMRGQFSHKGTARVIVPRNGQSTVAVALTLDPGNDQVTGTVTSGTVVSTFNAGRLTPDASIAGQYTMALVSTSTAAGVPQGAGYAFVKVQPNGVVEVTGAMADGAPFSSTSYLKGDKTFPIYGSLYGGLFPHAGSVGGTIQFEAIPNNSDAHGCCFWFKPANAQSAIYKTGISTSVEAILSAYTRPAAGAQILNWGSSTNNGVVDLSFGNLTSGITKTVTLTSNNQVTVSDPGADQLTMFFQVKNGSFSGTFIHPVTHKRVAFKGVVLQKQKDGTGYFIGSSESGLIEIAPAP